MGQQQTDSGAVLLSSCVEDDERHDVESLQRLLRLDDVDLTEESSFKREYLGQFSDDATSSEIRTCRHCALGKQQHATDGKCLFESTYFESMSPEEMIQHIGDIMKAWHKKWDR